jgi:hypothetical protein
VVRHKGLWIPESGFETRPPDRCTHDVRRACSSAVEHQQTPWPPFVRMPGRWIRVIACYAGGRRFESGQAHRGRVTVRAARVTPGDRSSAHRARACHSPGLAASRHSIAGGPPPLGYRSARPTLNPRARGRAAPFVRLPHTHDRTTAVVRHTAPLRGSPPLGYRLSRASRPSVHDSSAHAAVSRGARARTRRRSMTAGLGPAARAERRAPGRRT